MPKNSTLEQTLADTRVVCHTSEIVLIARRIEALAEDMDTAPPGRVEWLTSIRERLAIIENDIQWARYGRVEGGS